MVVTLCNQPGIRRRHSAPEASASSERSVAWPLPVCGIMPSAEISPARSASRCLRDVPISCRRKAATAMRNAAHTRRGGVSTLRSLSTGLTSLQPATIFAVAASLGAVNAGWMPADGPTGARQRPCGECRQGPVPRRLRQPATPANAHPPYWHSRGSRRAPVRRPARGARRPRCFRIWRPALPRSRRLVGPAWQYRIGHAGRQ
jgi:hypothetical protein